MAEWLRRRTCNAKIPGSIPGYGICHVGGVVNATPC